MTILEVARALAPTLAARAAESEELRTMPADLVEEVRQAGLFHLAMPAGLGGPPEEPATIIEVIEELSAADGSGGWTILIGNASSFVAWLEPEVAENVVAARADAITASAFSPSGQAVPDGEGSYTVSGRWPFTSGAPHADWVVNGVIVMDGDRPRMLPSGRPDWRFAWMPAGAVTVEDTWKAAGLRGTGSHHTAAQGVGVPEEWTARPLFEPAKADDPLFRVPFFSLIMVFFAGFPLGVGRRALEEFTTLAQAKSRRMDGRPMMEDETVQAEVARLDATLGSARAYVFATVGEAWDTVVAGDPVSVAQRARIASAVQHAIRSGVDVADTTFRLAGGGALYDTSPLQRCFRDVHAAAQHFGVSLAVQRTVGRILLGLDPASMMF